MIIYDLSKLSPEVRDQILTSDKYTKWFSEFPSKIFNKDNPKTSKDFKKGISILVNYGSPAKKSGVNMCPMAHIAECEAPCLDEAGRGAMNSVQMSRLRKTLFFNQYREKFMEMFKQEVLTHAKYCQKNNLIPAVRPNGTWDFRWELIAWDFMVEMYNKYGVRWYDYTKIPNRIIPDPKVYDLTFSYSGVQLYQKFVDTAKALGMRIAVVFRHVEDIPKQFMGMHVVGGDDGDARFLEPQGVICALYAKGKAVHDDSGFVVG